MATSTCSRSGPRLLSTRGCQHGLSRPMLHEHPTLPQLAQAALHWGDADTDVQMHVESVCHACASTVRKLQRHLSRGALAKAAAGTLGDAEKAHLDACPACRRKAAAVLH